LLRVWGDEWNYHKLLLPTCARADRLKAPTLEAPAVNEPSEQYIRDKLISSDLELRRGPLRRTCSIRARCPFDGTLGDERGAPLPRRGNVTRKPTEHAATRATPEMEIPRVVTRGRGGGRGGKKPARSLYLHARAVTFSLSREAAIVCPGDRGRNLDAVGRVTRMHYAVNGSSNGDPHQKPRSTSPPFLSLSLSLSLALSSPRARARGSNTDILRTRQGRKFSARCLSPQRVYSVLFIILARLYRRAPCTETRDKTVSGIQ